ncbi:MAG: hypothetical protein LWX55_14550 [Deltaproteobacteria bacterium]|nr:hypothetical protein [Deltaproteobacteria bacterium]
MELTPVVARSHTSLCTDATILAAHPADVEQTRCARACNSAAFVVYHHHGGSNDTGDISHGIRWL